MGDVIRGPTTLVLGCIFPFDHPGSYPSSPSVNYCFTDVVTILVYVFPYVKFLFWYGDHEIGK